MNATNPQFLPRRRWSSSRGHMILTLPMGPKRPNSRARCASLTCNTKPAAQHVAGTTAIAVPPCRMACADSSQCWHVALPTQTCMTSFPLFPRVPPCRATMHAGVRWFQQSMGVVVLHEWFHKSVPVLLLTGSPQGVCCPHTGWW